MLIWDEKYATGIERVDRQHQLLFNYINALEGGLSQGVDEETLENNIKSLETYAAKHFGFEEECMEAYKCPMAQKNKAEHKKFVEAIEAYKDRVEKGEDKAKIFGDLHHAAEGWLKNHICSVDIHLKKYVKEQGQNPGGRILGENPGGQNPGGRVP